jgi:DNA polymerase-3 subunit delta'
MIFSWQNQTWLRLMGRLEQLPHALLLAGPQGGGKSEFARTLAARLLCEKAEGAAFACGECLPCGWFASGNHPDFRLIEPGGGEAGDEDGESTIESVPAKRKSEQIRIDQIRALEDFLAVGTHRHGARIVIIQPAEAMNQATANSLLKVLEEPSSSTLFLFVSNNPRRLLPTIRSRCQAIEFPKPDRDEALAWLQHEKTAGAEELLAHAGGMPLAAATEAANDGQLDKFVGDLAAIGRAGPVATAARWEFWLKEGKEGGSYMDKRTLVTWMQKWVYDLVSVKIADRAIYHGRRLPELRAASSGVSASGLIDCYNELLRIRAVAQHPLNSRLFLEDMLSRYARAVAAGTNGKDCK